jgi:hypothetical protein
MAARNSNLFTIRIMLMSSAGSSKYAKKIIKMLFKRK